MPNPDQRIHGLSLPSPSRTRDAARFSFLLATPAIYPTATQPTITNTVAAALDSAHRRDISAIPVVTAPATMTCHGRTRYSCHEAAEPALTGSPNTGEAGKHRWSSQ
jgi:hypothetical protein